MTHQYYLISTINNKQYHIYASIYAISRDVANRYFDDIAYKKWGYKLDIVSNTLLKNYQVVTKTDLRRWKLSNLI